MDVNSDTSLLISLGRVFRAELLVKKAVDQVSDRCTHVQTRLFLARLNLMHSANQHQLRTICDNLSFSPADHFEIPDAIEKLMTKRNIPERLLLSWLNQCETMLGNLYEDIEAADLPDSTEFLKIRARLKSYASELNLITLDTTEINDMSCWNSEEPVLDF